MSVARRRTGPASVRRPLGRVPAGARGHPGGRGRPGAPFRRLLARLPERDDRGSAPVELAVLAIVSFLFIVFIVFAGRLNVGSAHTEAAARSAARTISAARDPQSAVGDAEADARNTVNEGSAMCRSMGFHPEISADRVEVTISCEVDLSEATLLEVPGSMTVSATAAEVIDRYRETESREAAP
ncbi:MAG TPA: TadE family protein [Acidimicrobiales bacterium]